MPLYIPVTILFRGGGLNPKLGTYNHESKTLRFLQLHKQPSFSGKGWEHKLCVLTCGGNVGANRVCEVWYTDKDCSEMTLMIFQAHGSRQWGCKTVGDGKNCMGLLGS